MSKQIELNSYLDAMQRRLRLKKIARGAAVLFASALLTTIALVLLLNAFAFPVRGVIASRIALGVLLANVAVLMLWLPVWRLTRRRAASEVERARPELEQRLLTFEDRQKNPDAFVELLAAETLAAVEESQPKHLVPDCLLFALTGAGLASLALLVWLVAAGPGYVGYGAGLLWTGPKHNRAPLYDVRVSPGNITVRRNSDLLITADLVGLKTSDVKIFARYQSALVKYGASAGWEPAAMQSGPAGAAQFQFPFAALTEDVEYYVQAGPMQSQHFKVHVVDMPSVQQIAVTYHYPSWTGMKPASDDHGGDLRAVEGTDAELAIRMDRPMRDGLLVLDDGTQLHLIDAKENVYMGTVHMQKDGAYHVAALDENQPVRLSEDYFIATDKATPPEISINRPGGDYRASPIEEVTVGVKAAGEYGLNKASLHYSINGGPDHAVNLMKAAGAKNVTGDVTLNLEDYKLVPGDVISVYASTADGHSEAHTDISFIQVDPFEREFSQSQQSGGGGGGQAQNQTDISRREKELISETWKRLNNKSAPAKEASDAAAFLSDAQVKLREQVLALQGRAQSRELDGANEEFTSFEKDMIAAALAMQPAAEKLKQMQWQNALPEEQKALQALLRAEATLRQIQVAFGQRGGGGGGGGSAGRDLASLFDLELDTEKNEYETAQSASPEEERAKAVDDALQKLDALARRQEELAQQQHGNPQNFQERWQQEMLRREAEQLQRQMEQMQQNAQNGSQQSNGGQSGNSQSQQAQSSGQTSGQAGSQSGTQSRAGGDQRIQDALQRLRDADQAMKRNEGTQQNGNTPGNTASNADAARRAAEQLKQASNLLGGTQQQQANGKLDSMSQEAGRLANEERAQNDRVNRLKDSQSAAAQRANSGQSAEAQNEDMQARMRELQKLAEDREQLAEDLQQLTTAMRNSARELAPNHAATSSKLRDALSGIDQDDLNNRVQRTADWLRRGIDPNSNGTEAGIAKDLQQLNSQLHQAQQTLGTETPGHNAQQGDEMAALDHVDKLRSRIESLANGGQQGQRGQQGQGGQQGPGSGQQIGRNGSGGAAGQNGQPNAGGNSGDIGNRQGGGGQGGTAWSNVNTGNNQYSRGGTATPNTTPSGDPQREYRAGLDELNQIRHLVQNDPAVAKEVQELIRQMQQLDPSRFPGNPAMVEQMHQEMLGDIDKLELQIHRDTGDENAGQMRSAKSATVPAGYRDAVADYYRRLSSNQKNQ